MLHDLGLTDEVPVQERFEIEGADRARLFLSKLGLSDRQLDLVWDAIALHTTYAIPQRKCPEIALCQLGIAIDVGYAPLELVTPSLLAEIVEAFPVLDYPEALLSSLHRLFQKTPAAAASPAVADVCERRVPGFQRMNLCDRVKGVAFPPVR